MLASNRFDARSFRDPDGRLVIEGQRVFRVLTPESAARLNDVLARPSVQRGIASGEIIGTRLADAATLPGALRDGGLVVYEHELIPFVSYAHEWPPAMLAQAATFTLQLAQRLLHDDLLLKDATPANVLFRRGKPVLVDILSIVPRQQGSYLWLAGNQFETTFLLPLIANVLAGVPLSWSAQDTYLGVSHQQLARLLGIRRWFSLALIAAVALPAALSKGERATQAFVEPKRENDELASFILRRTLARLEKRVHRLMRSDRRGSFWKGYTDTRTHYAAEDIEDKKAFVAESLRKVQPQWTLDIGANTGEFSALAARSSSVVALEIDEKSADEIYRRAAETGLDVHPLVGNFARPAPGLGWGNGESESFLRRAQQRFDLVLMLAVVHHLRVTAGIPIPALLDTVATVTRGHVLLEYVPPTDSMFRRLARGRDELYADCGAAAFEAEFAHRFAVVDMRPLGNGRALYLGKRLRPD